MICNVVFTFAHTQVISSTVLRVQAYTTGRLTDCPSGLQWWCIRGGGEIKETYIPLVFFFFSKSIRVYSYDCVFITSPDNNSTIHLMENVDC